MLEPKVVETWKREIELRWWCSSTSPLCIADTRSICTFSYSPGVVHWLGSYSAHVSTLYLYGGYIVQRGDAWSEGIHLRRQRSCYPMQAVIAY